MQATGTGHDLCLFGEDVLPRRDPNLQLVKGDIRDRAALARALDGADIVIHLACYIQRSIFELNPSLSKSINYDCFEPLVQLSKSQGVRRFVYASTPVCTASVKRTEVTEDHPLVPLTDYNKFKGLCEPILARYQSDSFTNGDHSSLDRCGYSPRLRLDLTVNILTNHAVNKPEDSHLRRHPEAPQHPHRRHHRSVRRVAGAAAERIGRWRL